MVRGGPGEQEGGGEGGRNALRGAAERLQGQVRAALDARAPAHQTDPSLILLKMAMAFVHAWQLAHARPEPQQIPRGFSSSSRLAPRLALAFTAPAGCRPQRFLKAEWDGGRASSVLVLLVY
jgi:hypothetical protein